MIYINIEILHVMVTSLNLKVVNLNPDDENSIDS
jgi:hypothetical protein